MSFLHPTSCIKALTSAHEQKLLKSGRYTHCAVGTLIFAALEIRDPRWIQALDAYTMGTVSDNVPHITFYTNAIGCTPEDLIQLEMAFEGRKSPNEMRDAKLSDLDRLNRALNLFSVSTVKMEVA